MMTNSNCLSIYVGRKSPKKFSNAIIVISGGVASLEITFIKLRGTYGTSALVEPLKNE